MPTVHSKGSFLPGFDRLSSLSQGFHNIIRFATTSVGYGNHHDKHLSTTLQAHSANSGNIGGMILRLTKKLLSNKYLYISLVLAIIAKFGVTYLKRNVTTRIRSLSKEHSTAIANSSAPSKNKTMEGNNQTRDGLTPLFFKKLLHLSLKSFRSPMGISNGSSIGVAILLTALVIIQSIVVCKTNFISGDMMEYLMARNKSKFFYSTAQFTLAILIQSLVSPTIKSLIEWLSLDMRRNLTMNVHDHYFSNMVYYKINNLDKRIGSADQRITQDIDIFCTKIAELFTDMLHPFVDLILYTIELVRMIGSGGLISVLCYLVVAFSILSKVTPNFTRISSEVQNLEGKFRFAHTRCKVNAEVISFYGGENSERKKVEDSFEKLTTFSEYVIGKNFQFGVVNDFFTKYFPHSYTTFIIGIAVFYSRLRFLRGDVLLGKLRYIIAVVTFEFYALGNIIELFRKLMRLSGITQRVSLLYTVMNEIKHGQSENINFQKQIGGEIVESDEISFDNVIIKTPDNITLARNLSFHVGKNEHIVISGSNGSGKSSLFRVLGALWPLYSGTIHKPQAQGSNSSGLFKEIFYLPQKPYNITGTLRSQIIYPDITMKEGWNDTRLEELLHDFGIGYLATRTVGGFDSVQDWDSLSRGEQQKLAMVRLFYHKPKYAILDECTSCISAEDEERLYQRCTKSEITCITISHRPALERYHKQRLVFNGKGGYRWEDIEHDGEGEPTYKLKGMDLSLRDDIKEE